MALFHIKHNITSASGYHEEKLACSALQYYQDLTDYVQTLFLPPLPRLLKKNRTLLPCQKEIGRHLQDETFFFFFLSPFLYYRSQVSPPGVTWD